MKTRTLWFGLVWVMVSWTQAQAQQNRYNTSDLGIKDVAVTHHSDYGVLTWEITVEGEAGKTIPEERGQLDEAPVLGYVFPTNLKSTDVGFNPTDGIVALALTSHPDFDDTPLWDENSDQIFDNDGVVWHPHWVILTEDSRVSGGLAVKQFKQEDQSVVLPPTNPGMPMYMDSPGFPVVSSDHSIKVVVPAYRMNNQTSFRYDGVTAFMRVNTSNEALPLLGVYQVFSVASGDLSLPYEVKQ